MSQHTRRIKQNIIRKRCLTNSQKAINIRNTKRVTKVTRKEDDMRTYSILKQLNSELEAEGYVAVRGKIPRPYWETKFYGFSDKSM